MGVLSGEVTAKDAMEEEEEEDKVSKRKKILVVLKIVWMLFTASLTFFC